jgi:hypothetical protein
VRYEIARTPLRVTNCHCSQCRKAHGAAYATYAAVERADFRFTAGAERVRRFQSSAPVQRSFCEVCGSNLAFESDEQRGRLWIAAGGFDDDPGVRPQRHIYVGSKAPWFEIADSLPRHAEHD